MYMHMTLKITWSSTNFVEYPLKKFDELRTYKIKGSIRTYSANIRRIGLIRKFDRSPRVKNGGKKQNIGFSATLSIPYYNSRILKPSAFV